MSTRSFVAKPEGDGFRGRYVHWDGYPSAKGPRLTELVAAHGLDRVRQVVIEDNYGWSSLDTEDLGAGYTDGRFKVVPGFGIAYTTVENQSSPDDWLVWNGKPAEWDDYGTEYGYVLMDDGQVAVYTCGHMQPTLVGIYALDSSTDWEAVESEARS